MSRFDTLPDWLVWLETLHPKAIDMGLGRVRDVAVRLGVLSPGVPVVTVAGTNGKGSTTAILEALLLAHGRRVGCYTSPHILRFNERIRVDGIEAADADIVRALATVDAARDGISLTYFEFTTLAAFVLFAEARLDVWVLEIGLGGRLDAVNVIDPDVAVLTSIGIDHQEWLGDTREAIGAEKAGIFRAGMPAVIGDTEPPRSVCAALDKLHATAYFAGHQFHHVVTPPGQAGVASWTWQGKDAHGGPITLADLPQPHLALANASTALQSFVLLPLACDAAAVGRAMSTVRLPGRNQCVDVGARTVVVDVGHNADGLRFLRAELARGRRGDRFHVVLGMLADKDIRAAVSVLEPLGESWHIAPLPTPRSATTTQLRDELAALGIRKINEHPGIADALRGALASGDGLPVLVTGSFYTVSEAMLMLDREASR